MADRTIRFMVISRFEKACKDHGYPKPNLNKNKEQWAADALLESYRLDEIQSAMEYYFKISSRPTWGRFANNVGELLDSMESQRKDDEFRKEMREKGKAWLES
jgi:hypothetical protein